MSNSTKKKRPLIAFKNHSRINWALQNPTAFSKKYFFNKYSFNGVCKTIAPEDDMYTGDKDHYFGVGESALKNILATLNLANKKNPLSILDIPCGYGRVMRYIKKGFPDAKITACDLDKKMVDFCMETFGAKGVYSDKNIKKVQINGKFDLIWCGSLFTHLDKDLWSSFFEFFHDHLTEKGVVIFTTHGRCVKKRMVNKIYNYGILEEEISPVVDSYATTGFGYANYPNSEDYGISLSSPAWVLAKLAKFRDTRIMLFSEQSWDAHQDVIACIKERNFA